MRRSVILTPAVLVPIAVLAAVALFLAYLYYQFTTFAVPPRIEITEPAGDAIVQSAEYTIRGRTVPDARVITIRVFPAAETIADVRPAADGTFSARVPLKPGANHVEINVIDATGKGNQASRKISYEAARASASPSPAAPDVRLLVQQPAEGAVFTNAPVPVAGTVAAGSTVTVNGTVVAVANFAFTTTLVLPAGAQTIRIAAKSASGVEVFATRSVSVAYRGTFVLVRIQGTEAWLQAIVDGAQVPGTGRLFAPGQTISFTGQVVTLRTGNAGATFVNVNGQELGRLGNEGQVVDRTFTQ